MRRLSAVICFLVLSAIARGPAAAEPPAVVVSVQPVHALVSGIMDGVGLPRLLVRAGVAPQTFALRASQERALAEADIVIRVGGGVDAFLDDAIAALPPDVRVITLVDLDLPVVLPRRTQGLWRKATPPIVESDPFLWLDTENAAAVVRVVTQELTRLDRLHKIDYSRNAETIVARLGGLHRQLRRALDRYRGRPYVVEFDAYRYFEQRYGLEAVGALLPGIGAEPDADHLDLLRDEVDGLGIACLALLPQVEAESTAAFAGEMALRTVPLDPMGSPDERGANVYFEMMRDLSKSIARCLD